MRAHPSYDWSDPVMIAANRVGELTPEQRMSVGRPLNWGCLLLGSSVLVACFAGPALVAERNGDPSGFLYLAASLVVVPLLLAINWRSARDRREAATGHVAQAQGQVVWRGRRYVAEIAGRRLRPLRHYALPAPGPYQFFYLARAGLLLSAERLHGAVPPVPGLLSAEPAHGFREAAQNSMPASQRAV